MTSQTLNDSTSWEVKAAKKRAECDAKIPSEWRLPAEYLQNANATSHISVMDVPAKCGILTSAELGITEKYSAVELAQAVQSGRLKSLDVATAFCKRAAIAQQLTSCLTEIMFDDALKRGEYLDQYLIENKEPVGPLHGVPISIKDGFNYKGVQSTLGFVSFLDREPATENSALVQILIEQGAILYCKTNIPQTLMTADSENNIFGRTLNPHKLSLGAGGSSGGEGALVALRGSILGVGTDIGGSIRIPALCCGTYGFKPSTFRIPSLGQTPPARLGSPGIPAVAGPLANSFEDLQFFLRHVIEKKPWKRDPFALAVPWRASDAAAQPAKLRVGFWLGDADVPIHPPVERTLREAEKKLSAAGITIVPITEHPSAQEAIDLAQNFFSLDPDNVFLQNIEKSGEPIIKSLQKTMHLVNYRSDYTVSEVYDLNVARMKYAACWHKCFRENELDVLVCPGAQNTAVPHDLYGSPPYTAMFNLLEYPGVILPFGFADKAIDKDELAKPDPSRPYSAEAVHGAPTSIQIVALRYHDEELIAASRVIDKALRQ